MSRRIVVVAVACFAVACFAVGCAAGTTTPTPPPPPRVSFVVDVQAPVPELPPWSPSFNPRRIRGLVHDEARTIVGNRDVPDKDDLDFALLKDGGARGHLVVDGVVGARPVAITLDTAAGRTLVTRDLVRHLGLTPIGEHVVRDINGVEMAASEVELPDVVVAGVRFRGIVALVGDTALRDDLFLLGGDALRRVDLVYDGPLGAVAFLPAGSALDDPATFDDADIVAMDTTDRLVVQASAPGSRGEVTFELVVDMGSPLTAVAATAGVNGGLPADTSTSVTLKGAGGVANERRGRFMLWPLSLGLVQMGTVSAIETGEALGVVGTDVLGRARVVISAARHALAFLPSTACSGDRLVQGTPSLRLRPQAVDGDFFLDVSGPLGETGVRFLLRSHDRQTGAPRGGAVEVTVGARYRGRLETGLPFGVGPVSMLVLPRTSAACTGVCTKLLGSWPVKPPPDPD